MFDNLIEYYAARLNELDRRVGAGDQPADYEHQCADLYAHTLKSLLTDKAMMQAENNGQRGMSYGDGRMPSTRGMNYNNGSSYRGGYSRADRMDEVVASVNNAMGDMPDDMRMEAQRFLDRMQRTQGMR